MPRQNRGTLPSPIHDHPDWHRGRQYYSVWLIKLGSMEVSQKVAAAREPLSAFLIKPYQRQPNITVYVCGFRSDTPCYDDETPVPQIIAADTPHPIRYHTDQ